MHAPGLKVCGITRRADLEVCTSLGVDAVGINLWSGSKRGLTLDAAAALLEGAGRGVLRIGVSVDHAPGALDAAARRLHLDAIQPHGDADPRLFAALGRPWVWVVRGTPQLSSLRVPTPEPMWVLLDAAVAGYGGAGAQTDWAWAAEAVRALAPLPVWLAGGITVDNAAAALRQVRPAGLDVASGSESPGADRGQKDAARIAALLDAMRAVD